MNERERREKLFERIYNQHYASRVNSLRRYDITIEQAEDCTMETFKIFWVHIDEFADESLIGRWLMKVSKRVVLDLKRKYEFRIVDSLEAHISAVGDTFESPDKNPHTSLLLNDTAQKVLDAFASIPNTSQELLLEKYFLDLSLAEIGAKRKIGEGAAKTRVNRALILLRKVFLNQAI
jgi:RNA polymerase sigma factor (sigma-70 family)